MNKIIFLNMLLVLFHFSLLHPKKTQPEPFPLYESKDKRDSDSDSDNKESKESDLDKRIQTFLDCIERGEQKKIETFLQDKKFIASLNVAAADAVFNVAYDNETIRNLCLENTHFYALLRPYGFLIEPKIDVQEISKRAEFIAYKYLLYRADAQAIEKDLSEAIELGYGAQVLPPLLSQLIIRAKLQPQQIINLFLKACEYNDQKLVTKFLENKDVLGLATFIQPLFHYLWKRQNQVQILEQLMKNEEFSTALNILFYRHLDIRQQFIGYFIAAAQQNKESLVQYILSNVVLSSPLSIDTLNEAKEKTSNSTITQLIEEQLTRLMQVKPRSTCSGRPCVIL